MKIVKWILVLVVILFVIGFGVYHLGVNYASEKLIDTVSKEWETSGKMEEMKKAIESDPELKAFIKEGVTLPEESPVSTNQGDTVKPITEKSKEETTPVNEAKKTTETQKLPFHTKEEATKVVIQKVGISKLKDMLTNYKEGTASKEEIIQEISSKLTKEEIMALKVIAYKELYNK